MFPDGSPTGDDARLGAAFVEHADALRRHAARIGAPPESVDDVVADAFASVAAFDRARLASIANLRAYLFTAVTSNVRTLLRRRSRERTAGDEMLDQALEDFTGPVELEDTMVLVHAALATLPDFDRSLLRETLLRGRAPSDIARELGVDGTRIRTAARRARARFRLAYIREFIARTPPSCGVDPDVLARIAVGMASSTQRHGYAAHQRTCEHCPALVRSARTELALGSLLPIALLIALASCAPHPTEPEIAGIPPPAAPAAPTSAGSVA